MSESQAADQGSADQEDDADTIAQAARMGWKPKDKFARDPTKYLSAREFLDRGLASPAVLAERYRVLDDRSQQAERRELVTQQKLDQALEAVNTLTSMNRSAEQRAYERARREILEKREEAVAAGDTATFKEADTALTELDKEKPAPAPAAGAGTAGPAGGQSTQRTTAVATDPAVQAFYAASPWYHYRGNSSGAVDAEMSQEADTLHVGLLNTRPDWSVEQNLAEVTKRLREKFPAKFGIKPAAAAATQDAGGNKDGGGRQNDAPVVLPSGEANDRRPARRNTFATMPQDSKDAFGRYKQMLAGKGKPLTEEEWATNYWAQFAE